MAIEDRIKALEDESKVLKNVIQATLLDIQKEILTHYYAPEHKEVTEVAGNVGWQRELFTDEPVVAESSARQDGEGVDGSKPRSGQERGSQPEPTEREREATCLDDREIWATVAKLLIWLSDSVSELGRERMAKAIKMYGAYGYISPEMRKVLMALIAFSRDAEPPTHFSLKQLLEKLAELSNILRVGGQPINLNHVLALVQELERSE